MWKECNCRYVNLITPSGQFTAWRRIPEERIDEWITSNPGALSYFSTIQSFSGTEKGESEPHWSPMFFDMDAPDDVSETERLEAALADTRILVDYFLQGFDTESQVWFTGGRGFHVLVPGDAFGASPDPTLTYHWKHLASRIKTKLSLGTLDLRVYSIPRMWRIPNTKHRSGLYKVPLYITDLARGITYILSCAKAPRRLELEDDSEESRVEHGLTALYKEAKDEYRERVKVAEFTPDFEIPKFGDEPPACVRFLFGAGLVLLGTKNRADMALSNFCKADGLSIEDAIKIMSEWSRSIPLALTHEDNLEARVAQTLRVLQTVYSDPKYRFSCGSMRACGLEEIIDCAVCEVAIESKPVDISLAEFSSADNFARRVRLEADLVGKDSHELIVPKKIVGWCPFNPESAQCAACGLSNYYNSEAKRMQRTVILSANEPLTVSLIDVSVQSLHHRIKQMFKVQSRCQDFQYETEWGNANVVYLASRVSGDFKIEKEISRSRAIFLGHEIELNQGYLLEGVVWSHPQSMQATMLIDRMELLKSSLLTFTLESDELTELGIFRVTKNQTVLSKITEIHDAFMRDFIRIPGREDLLLAYDLVFHSVRRFHFQREENTKGWLDILCIGDTGQGKTEVALRLMNHYGLGIMASGESASRTGLLYTIHMISGEEAWIAFGLMCRANGYLMVVDELHEMSPQDFRAFTKARSEGKVEVYRAAWGAARAETRMIGICNSRPGKSLASFAFPVQAIKDIPAFMALEDVRRWDYAVGAMSGEVGADVINRDQQMVEVPDHPYTSQACRNLVLWIWTRPPENILLTRKAELAVLERAKVMSDEYIPDIPLAEAADIRFKIARVAIALAGRTFSSDDGINLTVTEDHVQASYEVITQFYKSPALNYYGWSDDRKRVFHSEETVEALVFDFKAAFASAWDLIARWLLEVSDFTKSFLKTATGISNQEADQLMAFLMINKFITTEQNRYVKTPSGRMFLQRVLEIAQEVKEKAGEF